MIIEIVEKYLRKQEKTLDSAILQSAWKDFSYQAEKQFMSNEYDATGKLYPSSLGKCPRQVAYGYYGFPKTQRPGDRISLNMWFGNLVETGLIMLMKLAGLDIQEHQKIEFNLAGQEFRGYADAVVTINKEKYIIEIKSLTQYGFEEFEETGFKDREDYMTQLNLYLKYAEINKGIFLVACRNTGHIAEKYITTDDKYLDIAQNCVKCVLQGKENLPERMYSPDEKLAKIAGEKTIGLINEKNKPMVSKFIFKKVSSLGWRCSYCNWVSVCFPDYKMEFVGGKPVFLRRLE